ncbi:MAG TPA: ABC transporter ATP-binding protein [Candidatus Coproplasma avicola]|uniref:ABC transporter ATP-binding protein n=1 Tax=Candidatus Coproplasma avicola TaxID=2840744 RepID=A0A9D1E5K7_9FIRM|nr:ABC transporter ATP-binding protein [Candidatus Coproplasma avicola]
MNALEIKNLTVDFGDFAIRKMNLDIKKGAVTGLVGRNGAGKSTLIKTIMRQQPATGSILYDGKKFSEHEVEILSKTACVFDAPHFSLSAKPKKLKKAFAALYPAFNGQMFDELCAKFNLPQDKRVVKYSLGMQRKLCIIIALCQSPELLILDEPTSGIDPVDRAEVVALLQQFMLDENHTILFSTHITEDLDKIADYIVMIENGRILLNEDKVTLTEKYRLVSAGTMTEELRAIAIGLKQNAFGYTFICDRPVEGEGISSKIPTVEELFVYLSAGNMNGDMRQ